MIGYDVTLFQENKLVLTHKTIIKIFFLSEVALFMHKILLVVHLHRLTLIIDMERFHVLLFVSSRIMSWGVYLSGCVL